MKEMSTTTSTCWPRKWWAAVPRANEIDKEHRFLFIDKIAGGAIPREFIARLKRAFAKRWTTHLAGSDGGVAQC